MGDVPAVQLRDEVVEETLPPEPKSGSAPDTASSNGPSKLLQDPVKVARPVNEAPRPAGIEYRSVSHSYAAPGNHETRMTPLNMVDMSSALPAYQTASLPFGQPNVQQQYVQTYQSQGIMYPVQQIPYIGHPGNTRHNVPYSPTYQHPYMQQHAQSQPGYPPFHPSHQAGAPVHTQPAIYSPSYYSQHPYNAGFETNQRISSVHRNEQPPRDYHHRQLSQVSPRRDIERRASAADYDVAQTIVDGSLPMKPPRVPPNIPEHNQSRLPFAVAPSTPRGPSRKPKQSGHALWVGNLPPAANVVELKDHFSKDATNDIESVFLIAKSNCAFVNYKSEDACAAAVMRFHDSRFHGVRLVCRLRKGVTVTGSSQHARDSDGRSFPAQNNDSMVTSAESENVTSNPARKSLRVPERFFIVKSLTVEDLELSRQSGVWATQTHNETVLNEAYESADNVYLIFSANKSGEYFGYARMISPIRNDDALALEMPQRVEDVLIETDGFTVTPTEATATAPKGRIINDSARGTVFWEADSSEDSDDGDDNLADESDDNDDNDNDDNNEERGVDGDASKSERNAEISEDNAGTGAQSLGKPFRIQWMSTERVPFYRTRGLRNPWNANREVKIARDGTEIEPSVGRRLTQLFHSHVAGPAATSSGGQTGLGFQRPY